MHSGISYKLAFLFALLFSLEALFAQPILYFQNHAPQIGDTNAYYNLDTLGLSEGGSGPNQFWDFSQIKTQGLLQSECFLNTAGCYEPDIDSYNQYDANIVINTNDNCNKTGLYIGNDSIIYLGKIRDSSCVYSPSVNVINQLPYPLLLFPFTYMSNYNVNKRNVFSDAYGRLLLPNNLILDSVLRVVSEETFGYSSYTLGANWFVKITTYKYYSKNFRFPIIEVIRQKATYYSAGGWSVENKFGKINSNEFIVGIENADAKSKSTFTIGPNPSTGEFVIHTNGPLKIEIFNSLGQLLESIDVQQSAFTKSLPSGIYYLKVADLNGNSQIKKLIITE